MLNEAFNSYNNQDKATPDCVKVKQSLFFAKSIHDLNEELCAYRVSLEKGEFEEILYKAFWNKIKRCQWLKGKKLEADLLSLGDTSLAQHGIAEVTVDRCTKSARDLYRWIDDGIEMLRTHLKAIILQSANLPAEYYSKYYKRKGAQINMEPVLGEYCEWKIGVGKLTHKKLKAFQTETVANFLNLNILRFADKPRVYEYDEMDLKRVKRELPLDFVFKDCFEEQAAIFRRMIMWVGDILYIDIEDYGKYICTYISQLTYDELMELYKLERMLSLIRQDMMRLMEKEKGGKKEPTVAEKAPIINNKVELLPVDRFVNRVKDIVQKMATHNGRKIVTNTRSWQGDYVFFVDGERIARMMDGLRKSQEEKLNDFLRPYQKCDGVSVVAPFIGKILENEELRVKELQNTDLDFAFAPFYGENSSATKKMSLRLDDDNLKVLFGAFEGLLRRYPKAG